MLPNHIWRSLVEKAGYKIEDIPKTWDAYYDFFKDVQKKLRAQGVRNVYGLGFQVTTNGVDPNNLFDYFLIAYGGQDIVTKDGQLHLDDPKVKDAVIKALTYPTTAYKEGFVPPGAINWNDADDNNAFHAKQIVMDLDGTISTEVAIIKDEQDYSDIVTMGLPLEQRRQAGAKPAHHRNGLIPQGRQERRGCQGFPQVLHPAERQQRVAEDRSRPQHSGDAGRSSRTIHGGSTADPHRAAYDAAGRARRRPCRPSGPSTRPLPRSRTSMSGAPPGSTS